MSLTSLGYTNNNTYIVTTWSLESFNDVFQTTSKPSTIHAVRQDQSHRWQRSHHHPVNLPLHAVNQPTDGSNPRYSWLKAHDPQHH